MGILEDNMLLLALFSHPWFASLEVQVNLEGSLVEERSILAREQWTLSEYEGSAGVWNAEDLWLGHSLQALLSIADRHHSEGFEVFNTFRYHR